ncbi:MFS transporter, FSR family, fosmidomycin resistance protein [Paenibacillus sp. UNCCL117]|uniref:MFS transporter n=1 Tax=unclassified Paenibacillus TaxID=185978 RepID=UPI000884BED3|nr:MULTISPECIES: MFS transporter [unclassified Paenibacillus]SDC44979.1 MFS transporter, FSR family, fosmidomycin resistance protein [Paenibacillus sp. cl123]SFW12620.1 MFS transporter, FSR family, fosmidomycin resistance protein [Paenibacillus sp. UNCCL117]
MKTATSSAVAAARTTSIYALAGVSLAHLLNDAMQSAVPAVFPLLRQSLHLSFTQIGWIAFMLNVTACVLQPFIGSYTDKRPIPLLLPAGMAFSLLGIVGMAYSSQFAGLLISAMLLGIGSSVLHPESSRVAHLAAGKGSGMAQSVFQVGGNTGQALAPLAVGFLVMPYGARGLMLFALAAIAGIAIQYAVSRWYKRQLTAPRAAKINRAAVAQPRGFVAMAITLLIVLLFSKFVYIASMTGYYAFYYMDRFQRPFEDAQIPLFVLQFAGMLGTLLGGPLADKFGRKRIIWFSIAGTAPFSLLLPYAGPNWSVVLAGMIGAILMSGFSVIIVYAQELLPGKIGTVSGLFFGLAFGLAGLGSVTMGWLMDLTSISFVIKLCAYLPLLGLLALLLPSDAKLAGNARESH